MVDFISPFVVRSTVQAVTPILFAALGGTLCGRVGVFNMAMEGQLLIGAFSAVAGSYLTGNVWAGVLIAVLTTTVFSAVLAYGSAVFRGDPVIICIGMNLLAAGLTAYLLRQMFGTSGVFSDPAVVELTKIRISVIDGIPWLGWILSRQTALTYLAWPLLALTALALYKTTIGLRLRGVGQDPEAAQSMGINVRLYKITTVLIAGGMVGLGGAQLSVGTVGIFSEGMSGGRGWIAVVACMLARNNPLMAALACILFGSADAASVKLQSQGLPNQLTDILPYLITLIALVISHNTKPASLSSEAARRP